MHQLQGSIAPESLAFIKQWISGLNKIKKDLDIEVIPPEFSSINTIHCNRDVSEFFKILLQLQKARKCVREKEPSIINEVRAGINNLLEQEINRDRTPAEFRYLEDECTQRTRCFEHGLGVYRAQSFRSEKFENVYDEGLVKFSEVKQRISELAEESENLFVGAKTRTAQLNKNKPEHNLIDAIGEFKEIIKIYKEQDSSVTNFASSVNKLFSEIESIESNQFSGFIADLPFLKNYVKSKRADIRELAERSLIEIQGPELQSSRSKAIASYRNEIKKDIKTLETKIREVDSFLKEISNNLDRLGSSVLAAHLEKGLKRGIISSFENIFLQLPDVDELIERITVNEKHLFSELNKTALPSGQNKN